MCGFVLQVETAFAATCAISTGRAVARILARVRVGVHNARIARTAVYDVQSAHTGVAVPITHPAAHALVRGVARLALEAGIEPAAAGKREPQETAQSRQQPEQ